MNAARKTIENIYEQKLLLALNFILDIWVPN